MRQEEPPSHPMALVQVEGQWCCCWRCWPATAAAVSEGYPQQEVGQR